MAKPKPERVHPKIGEIARERAYQDETDPRKARQCGYSKYVQAHWQHTGNLAPGCDLKDFLAWWDAFEAAVVAP